MGRPRRYKTPSPDDRNLCIYCYESFALSELTGEHIVSEGLGGTDDLDFASCEKCQKTISDGVELHCLRGMYQVLRATFGLPNKKKGGGNGKRKRPISSTMLKALTSAGVVDLEVPLSESVVAIPAYEFPPKILTPVKDWSKANSIAVHIDTGPDYRKNRPGIISSTTVIQEINFNLFSRLLAKTAHAYASKYVGRTAFEPLVCDFILGKIPDGDMWIGIATGVSSGDDLHYLARQWVPFDGYSYLVVYVRILRKTMNPVHQIVVGRRPLE